MSAIEEAGFGFATCLPDGRHHLVRDGVPMVVKRRRGVPADFFAAEAAGLQMLSACGALRVPAVLALDAGFIVLEELGRGRFDTHGWRCAGEGLARLHAQPAPRFGFHRDGYCGDSPQHNPPAADGREFIVEARLRPQLQRAVQSGRLQQADAARGERICQRLREWLPAARPVPVHGDLWLGNLHACGDGSPALIDAAAAHHGWAEADLAMLTLFGEPPAAFFDAYAAAGTLAPDWRERAPIHNLYHLLNHLNLFGGGYLAQVQAVLRRYGG